jgi:hypothetical protein
MTRMTRGRLPARVYWVRRALVLGTAVVLVVAIAHLLGGSSNGSSGPDTAARVSETTGPSSDGTPSDTTGSDPLTTETTKTPKNGHTKTPVVQPSGPCKPDDIQITPTVPKAIAGQDVTLVLDLQTISEPACTWTLSGSTLALKIAKGPTLIWTTVQCARAIPTQDLVLRSEAATRVKLTWDARESEPGCPEQTSWALPGTYHLHVAALAGKPQDTMFELSAPPTPQVTRTAKPHGHGTPSNEPSGSASGSPSNKPSGQKSGQPSGKPSNG